MEVFVDPTVAVDAAFATSKSEDEIVLKMAGLFKGIFGVDVHNEDGSLKNMQECLDEAD